MIRPFPIPLAKSGKVVRVVVPICTSGSVQQEHMRRRGAAVVSLIEAMSRAHYSVEVWAVLVINASNNKRSAYAVKVQSAAENYDPAMVAFGVGHPGMLRHLGFVVEEHENESFKRAYGIGTSYGHYPFDCVVEDLPKYAQNGPAIVLPMLDYKEVRKYETDEAIAKWIEEMVRKVESGELTREAQ